MDPEDQASINYYRSMYPEQGAFTRLVAWPTLAPELVPDHARKEMEDVQGLLIHPFHLSHAHRSDW